MLRLFIEGQELDINATFSHQITYAVDDLQNLDSKTTAFSKTIVLPGTANNNRLLGNIFNFANSNFTNDGNANVGYNFNASRSAKMRFEMNGLQIMKGTLRLLEIIVEGQNIEYEIALFGELGGFIAKLGNKKLEDLDFSIYNHNWNITNIAASWDNANAGQGYYYPLIDYGSVSLYNASNPSAYKKDYSYKAFRPALFAKEYLDKIITDNGYTWESNFLNTDFFNRLVIPNNYKGLLRKNTIDYVNALTNTSQYFTSLGTNGRTNTVLFSSPTLAANITYNNTTGIYQYTGAEAITIKMSINLTYSFVSLNGADGRIYFGTSTGQQAIITKYNIGTYNVSASVILTLSPNETFAIYNRVNTNIWYSMSSYSAVTINSGVIMSIKNEPATNIPYQYNDTIIFNDLLPKNIFQKDFFSSILKMFYLMVTEDKFKSRHLIIEPWVDFYDNDRTTYLDWSLKVDRSEAIRIKPMAELNARYYQLSYKSDTDYYNDKYKKLYSENYGDRIYDNGFEFAKQTDKTEVIFSPTPLVGYVGVDKVVSTIFKLNNAIEDPVESNIRILQAKKITSVSSWNIILPTGFGNYTTTVFPYAGHLDNPDAPNSDINFGATKELYFTLVSGALSNNLFNSYYSSYLAEITDKDSRVITVKMKFTEQEIYNLDFGKYILIDGVLYRLQKIIDYTPGELCKVELLRVISTNYQ